MKHAKTEVPKETKTTGESFFPGVGVGAGEETSLSPTLPGESAIDDSGAPVGDAAAVSREHDYQSLEKSLVILMVITFIWLLKETKLIKLESKHSHQQSPT